MPAPAIGFLVAFLTGAALPVAGADALFGQAGTALIIVDQKAATVYARMPAICAAADPALDKLADAADAAKAKSAWRRILAGAADRLARDADIVCKNAHEPNTALGRASAVAATIADLAKADGLVPPAKTTTPDPPVDAIPAARMCGRQPCR